MAKLPKTLGRILCLATGVGTVVGTVSAQTAQQKQQFDQIRQEYYVLKVAYNVDKTCALLSSVSRQNAYSKAFELGNSLRQLGVTFDQLEAFDKDIEQKLAGKTCEEYGNDPEVKLAKTITDIVAGMNVYIWQAYYEKHPSGALWRDDCGGGYSDNLTREAMSDQKFLAEKFKTSAQFNAISANIDAYIQNIHGVCEADGAFFKMTYAGNSLFKTVKHTIEVHNNMTPGEQRGFFEKSAGSQRWKAYRGATAKSQFDSDVPWAIMREAREKNATGSSIKTTFFENSAVNYGLTVDRHFVFSLRAPSMADFDTTIFNAVVLTNADTGEVWRPKKTEQYFTGYRAEVMAASNIKPGDPPHTVQFTLSASDSQSVIDAVAGDQKITVQVERMEEGKSRLVDVETINRESFEASMEYAFAPKINFPGT